MRLSQRCTVGVFKGGMISGKDAAAQSGFYSYKKSLSYNWLPPFFIAFAFHCLVVYLTFFSPLQLFRRPKHVEVMTVNLFHVTDLNNQNVESVLPPQIKDEQLSKEPTAPPVSLAPSKLKKKDINSDSEKLKRENILEKKLASIKAELDAKKAKEVAKSAVQDAVSRLANKYKDKYGSANAPTASGTEQSSLTETQKAYLISVHTHILNNWVLPDLQNWDKELEAVVVLKIDRQGKIIKSFFEKKTGNAYFNKFVEKAIKESDPLPPLPKDFQEDGMELGLRFRPGEIL
jgi:colicin import membrane protein